MRIVIGSDNEGMELKEVVKAYLLELGHEVVDLSEEPAADFVDSAVAVGLDLLAHPESLGFAFDRYGAGSYMAACKMKGLVACECSDERSAFMTRQHNNARLICLGAGVTNSVNKVPGARCCLVRDMAPAVYARENLAANVVGFGGKICGEFLIADIVDAFLAAQYRPTPENDALVAKIDAVWQGDAKAQAAPDFFDEFLAKWDEGCYHD